MSLVKTKLFYTNNFPRTSADIQFNAWIEENHDKITIQSIQFKALPHRENVILLIYEELWK
jgi:hypothetical protein